MIKIPKPQISLDNILHNCTYNMQNPRKGRINSVKSTIIAESVKYDELAEKGELYTLNEHTSVNSIATKDDMEALYTQKFVPKMEENRKYYNQIILLAPNNKCPYCGQNIVKTLDHFLPKSKYVTYTVTPYNLVPSCSDCNKHKLTSTFNDYTEQPLHPYYDNFDDEIWLKAKLIESEPISFQFYAEPPNTWNDIKKKRIVNNFNNLELNETYKIHAAELYYTCFNRIKKLYKIGGKSLAIERLEEYIEDELTLRNNSWKSAMYRAIIECDWYWNIYLASL